MEGVRARLCALAAQRLRGLAPAGGKKRVVDKGAPLSRRGGGGCNDYGRSLTQEGS
jgi:hypothetical protein